MKLKKQVLTKPRHRSPKANMVELGIQLSGIKRQFEDPSKLAVYLNQQATKVKKPFAFPKGTHFHVNYEIKAFEGLSYIVLNQQLRPAKRLVYFCGGEYAERPTKDHWNFLDQLAQVTKAQIYAPIVPTIAQGGAPVAYPWVRKFYEHLLDLDRHVPTMMLGDSAGGGLAAGFVSTLIDQNLLLPDQLVLISPWLDLSLANSAISDYEKSDVYLSVAGLQRIGQRWQGEWEQNDPRLSPVEADWTPEVPVQIFVGNKEIMYPDCLRFAEKLRQQHVSVDLQIGQQMFHDYPIYPTPEGQHVIKEIADFIG